MDALKRDIYWTGYVDWSLREFHGYATPSGSTYNAFLILDEKPTLIDTVKDYGFDEMLRRIKAVIDPAEIKYIISNHTEMDHSGSIQKLLKYCPQAEVVCSPKGAEELKYHFFPNGGPGAQDWKIKVVETGDELNIGKRTLKFVLMPMVHWPDSMATYSPEDKILFSNDAFGQHYASTERFVDEVGANVIYKKAAKYYANIVLPFGGQVLKALDAVASLDLDMICPSHGVLWRRQEDIAGIVNLYTKWAKHETENRVVIAYDSMWHSTEKMATCLYDLIDEDGIPVELVNLQGSHISDIVTKILTSKVFLVGTPILNNRMLPTIAGLLMYLKGLKPKNRFALSFGSYGWAKVGFKEVEESLKDAGFSLLGEGKYIQFVPDESKLKILNEVLTLIKEKFKEK